MSIREEFRALSAHAELGEQPEHERKFLIKGAVTINNLIGIPYFSIIQYYLAVGDTEVRIRAISDELGSTVYIKSGKRGKGKSRVELPVEYLSEEDFLSLQLQRVPSSNVIQKTRYLGMRTFDGGFIAGEVDIYNGALEGLVTLEREYSTEDAMGADIVYDVSGEFVFIEVSDDPRFKNQRLALEGIPKD